MKLSLRFGKQICICIRINLHFHETEVENTLNNVFSNIIKIMKIGKYFVESKFRHSLSKHHILKAILKYKNHPSIIIKSISQHFSSFYFSKVDKI